MSNQQKTLEDYGDFIKLDELEEMIKLLPKPEIIWRGIPRGSIGLIFGQSKTGKSTLAENLGYNIAAKRPEFLGQNLCVSENEKVVLANIEEPSRNRLQRHQSIVNSFSEAERQNINKRLIINGDYHGFFNTKKLWDKFTNKILAIKPSILFIDSLTRILEGDSKEDQPIIQIMGRLGKLNSELDATIIVIHHTTKMHGKNIDQDSIAGNHVLQQEIDFAIGLQKKGRNILIKDILNRYCLTDEQLIEAKINDDQTFALVGHKSIAEYHREKDARTDYTNRNKILDAVQDISQNSDADTVTNKQIIEQTGLAKRTFYENLKKLIEEGKLIKPDKGEVKPPA
jgi:RecA-family ATPase